MLPLDGIIRNANCCCIIAMHRRFWLQITPICQRFPEDYPILTVVEDGAQLGFCR